MIGTSFIGLWPCGWGFDEGGELVICGESLVINCVNLLVNTLIVLTKLVTVMTRGGNLAITKLVTGMLTLRILYKVYNHTTLLNKKSFFHSLSFSLTFFLFLILASVS